MVAFTYLSAVQGTAPSYPVMQGLATPTSSTTSCYQCIRGGWFWYNKLGTQYSTMTPAEITAEGSSCCDSNPSTTLDNSNCPGGYDSGNNLISTSIKSSTYLSYDFSIAACPQVTEICNSGLVKHDFADKNTVKQDVKITNLDATTKCTFLIKALKDAPGFRLKSVS